MKNNWQVKKLGEVCEMINRGVSPKYTNSQGLCVLNQKCIRDHKIDFSLSRIHDVKNKKINNEKLIRIGDVLVNSTGTGTLGRVAQVKNMLFEAIVDSHVTIIRPIKNVFYNEFFGYALIFIETEISKKGAGCGGQIELARDTLRNDFTITYPESLTEQKRIVTILDKAFANIDKAKENTEKNLQNVNDLFESYLKSVFSNPKKNWQVKKLGDVCTIIGGGTPSKSNADFYNGNILWATVCDMKNEVIFDTKYKITLEAVKKSSTNIIPKNNIVIATRVGLGKICLLKNDTAINQDLRGIIPKNTMNFSFKYLFWWLKSISKIIVESGTGATVQGVKLSFIKNLEIFTFPLREQQQIATKLDALSAQTKKLIDIYQKKIANLEELKKSLLQKAFTGELTDTAVNKNMELLL
ncbi:MAG: restriction endonuclease subunit S [Pseudomonadota bacterium]